MNYTVTEGDYLKFGVQKQKDGMIFTFAGRKEDDCAIVLYGESFEVTAKVQASPKFCKGEVRSVYVHGLKGKSVYYNYEKNGEIVTDSYALKIRGREIWNDKTREENDFFICGVYEEQNYVWNSDKQPEVQKSNMVMYKLHVRGFSMDAGLRGKMRGTFAAIEQKIPYLKSLGVTTLELMPLYEFEELQVHKKPKLPDYISYLAKRNEKMQNKEEQKIKLNYWGYTKGNYFAPKASYSRDKNTAKELKHLIDTLHENEMELVMEMYFCGDETQQFILDVLRYWAAEFHVDGFHLLGDNIPVLPAAQDLFLKRTKLFCPYFPEQIWQQKESYPHLYLYNDEYSYAAKKLLNRQGGTLYEFCNQQKKQNEHLGFVNFITNNNGFTLADLFSYSEKHNQENGEENADGCNYNFSINCGVEGKTVRRYVKEQRRKHIYMAFSMLFFAQGVPLFMAGDELLNSQDGNNNAYCQDNKIGWVNWKSNEQKQQLIEFVKNLAAFRKRHPILRLEKPMQLNDYLHKGCPDLSYHSENAWVSRFPEEKAAFGVMYNGSYANDDDIYIGYNFHAGISELALPKLSAKKSWHLVMDTAAEGQVFYKQEIKIENQHRTAVRPHSVVVLIGK